MANIKSQIKRIGTNKKAQERNKAVKSELKTAIRATREAISAGDAAKAGAALKLASKKLDKATSKGVIHANQAANRKSAIAKQVAALGTAPAKPAKAAATKAPAKAKAAAAE
jgi:small subunit ribosomal protein S20